MTLRIISLLFAILININSLFAQQHIEQIIKEGIKQTYNFQFQQAEKTFSELIKKYPNDPRSYHYKSTIFLWNYLGNSDKKDFDKFIQYSDQAISLAEKVLKSSAKNENAKFIIGSSNGYRAIAFGKAEKYLDMIWASKKSSDQLSDVIELNNQNYDAYLGLGLFKFALSKVPSAFKWALSTIGFNGDQDEGLRYINIAAEKGSFAKVEACFYLAQIYSEFFNDYDKSSIILDQLISDFPGNMLFIYTSAVNDLKERNLNKSERQLLKIVSDKKSGYKQIRSFSNFLLGDIKFRLNKFEEAKEFYISFLSTTSNNDYKGIAYYRLAISHELLDERLSSKMYFQYCNEGNSTLDDDAYAKRKGDVYAERELTESEKSLIRFSNMVEAKNYSTAIDSLKSLFDELENISLKAETAYWLSEAYLGLNQFNESIDYSNFAITAKQNSEKWITPFANYNLGIAYKGLNNFKKSIEFLDKAASFSNYDYESKLKSLISGARIKKDS